MLHANSAHAKPATLICGAETPNPKIPRFTFKCRKRKDHVLSVGKEARRHSDPKSYPPTYWEPTEEEILAAKEVYG